MSVVTNMRIAAVGCVHGQISRVYAAIIEAKQDPDCVVVCGDFQACRNAQDLESMSAPAKYRQLGDFHEYYNGTKKAPFLTIVVGGNHEASAYMSSLSMGGWLASNIWYIGDAGVVEVGGLRIGGISGIYWEQDLHKPRFEAELFARDPIRACESDAKYSVYHTRQETVNLMHSIGEGLDIVVTHDWPRGIEHYGDIKVLLTQKPFLEKDIYAGKLGNPATTKLLDSLKPQWWLSAHLHVFYTAEYKNTRFVALDKALPRRKFLSFIDVEPKGVQIKPHLTTELPCITLKLRNSYHEEME